MIALKPSILIGVAAQPGAFSPRVLRLMAQNHEHPFIFPLSNPTSMAECTAAAAFDATAGRCVFASGSPFPPVLLPDGRKVSASGSLLCARLWFCAPAYVGHSALPCFCCASALGRCGTNMSAGFLGPRSVELLFDLFLSANSDEFYSMMSTQMRVMTLVPHEPHCLPLGCSGKS